MVVSFVRGHSCGALHGQTRRFPARAVYAGGSYTLAEAGQRPVYAAWNSRKVDVGNPMFGSISAIFAPDFVRNMTLIAPIDTGA